MRLQGVFETFPDQIAHDGKELERVARTSCGDQEGRVLFGIVDDPVSVNDIRVPAHPGECDWFCLSARSDGIEHDLTLGQFRVNIGKLSLEGEERFSGDPA